MHTNKKNTKYVSTRRVTHNFHILL